MRRPPASFMCPVSPCANKWLLWTTKYRTRGLAVRVFDARVAKALTWKVAIRGAGTRATSKVADGTRTRVARSGSGPVHVREVPSDLRRVPGGCGSGSAMMECDATSALHGSLNRARNDEGGERGVRSTGSPPRCLALN